jgi:signal transduction histidine kinase/DNA-binding response OmpR family regulator/streptogramin lyase
MSVFGTENLEFEWLNSNNGLSSEEIRNIYQDREGYIWFLTREGLNRYDGHDFKIFKAGKSGPGFPSSAFESVCEDQHGRLWLGTVENGLIIFDKYSQEVCSFEEFSKGQKLADNHIRNLMSDSRGNIWIGTEYGLYRYQVPSGDLRFFNLGDFSSSEPVWCIIESMIEDARGDIWVGTWNTGLFRYEVINNEWHNYNLFNKSQATYNDNRIKSLHEDRYGNIWVGTWEDGLYNTKLTNNELVIQQYYLYDYANDQSIPGDIIYTINQDDHDNLWIGTPYGLCIIKNLYSVKPFFENRSFEFGRNKGLSNNEVWKIFKDRSGLMWLGTLEGGVNKVNPDGKIFESYTIPPVSDQIFSQTIQAFCIAPGNNFLVGIKSLGFGHYDLSRKKYIPYTQIDTYRALPQDINTVTCFLNENDRYLWLGTRYAGLMVFNFADERYTLLNELDNQFTYETINEIFKDNNGVFWVGTEEALYRVTRCSDDDPCFEIERIHQFDGMTIHDIMQSSNGDLWAGTAEKGIYRTKAGATSEDWDVFNGQSNNIITNRIQTIYEDSKGQLWAGTSDQGLLKYNKEKIVFERASNTKGLAGEMVYSMIEDSDHNLWLGTNNGLVRLIDTQDELIADSYTITDGLQGNIFIRGAILKQNNNRIFVGGYYGFNAFFPSDVKPNTYKPNTTITSISFNEKTHVYNPKAEEVVSYAFRDNNIVFHFSALSYFKSDKNSFAYMLEGFDDTWQYTDARSRIAQYPKLGAGSYTFLVKSSNSSDLWNQEPVMFSFKILPAPYKTWWAYSLYGLAFIIILIMIYRSILKNERIKRELEIEKIEHAKSEKLNQFKLRFFTNISHEILTPLSIISCSIDVIRSKTRKSRNELNIVERNVVQLNRLLHQLLDYRKMEGGFLKLQVEKGDFQAFIQQTAENFRLLADNKNIELIIAKKGTAKETWFDFDKMDKILDNLLSNAIKYTQAGGSVMVETSVMEEDGKTLARVSVIDTGKGIKPEDQERIFNRFYRSEHEDDDTGTGIGLAYTRSLVELHKGSISVKSELGKGSTFTVKQRVDRQFYLESEISKISDTNRIVTSGNGNGKESADNTPEMRMINTTGKVKLLLIDDNNDFRSVLKSHFSNDFRVIEAKNGQEGFRKALTEKPDIIVSDVMMPEKDGFELSLDLKNNIDTAHIPVILLTAKVDEEARSKGYSTGADSYITKPVNLSVLRTRINALLIKTRNPELQSIPVSTKPVSRSSMTEPRFLNAIEQYVKNHMSDSELSIGDIARHLFMSDSMFYRKVKQVTRMTPVEYVKNIRLNEAAGLLKKEDASIAEVAYTTGFSDQSYFTACFRKKFGITPKNYMIRAGKRSILLNK